MKVPKISVLMATHNGMPFLAESVESILKQTYNNFEFIIVDDASRDGSWEYLKSVRDKRLVIIRNTKNIGLAKSLNKALKKANGQYIARMDADDISLPSRLQEQFKFLNNNHVDVCGTWAYLIDEKGSVIGSKKFPLKNKEIKNGLKWRSTIIHPTIMAKKSFFNDLKGYRYDYDFAEDYDLLTRAISKYTMGNIGKLLFKWRMSPYRRSRKSINKMNKVDLKIKLGLYKSNYFGRAYIFILLIKIISTLAIPSFVKKNIADILKKP